MISSVRWSLCMSPANGGALVPSRLMVRQPIENCRLNGPTKIHQAPFSPGYIPAFFAEFLKLRIEEGHGLLRFCRCSCLI